MNDTRQSVLNIETLGHIDHGKTSLTRAITNVWTDRHSESIKRNMTIKLGYADAVIKECQDCPEPQRYTTGDKCQSCGGKVTPLFRISMLDAPGHETLMATAIAGSSVIDAVLFVIAANEPCPMQQTKEHLMVINLIGVKNVIVVQTKIDLVTPERARQSLEEIRAFLKGSSIEGAPIVPVMTNKGVNIDVILSMLVRMEKPKRDTSSDPLMYVVRSFDVNKPGINASEIKGGVLGGAIIKGIFKKGERVEIRPGIEQQSQKAKRDSYKPILTPIVGLNNGSEELDEAKPGGLIGISTEIDPSFTKADGLVGHVVGRPGKMPPTLSSITFKYHRLKRPDLEEPPFKENEAVILGIGTSTLVGFVRGSKKDNLTVDLRRPVCAEAGTKIAMLRNLGQRWRLTGYGIFGS